MDSFETPTQNDKEIMLYPTSTHSSRRNTEIESTKRSTVYFPTEAEEEYAIVESEYVTPFERTSEISEGYNEYKKPSSILKKTLDKSHHPKKVTDEKITSISKQLPTSENNIGIGQDFFVFFDEFSDSELSLITYVPPGSESEPDFFDEFGSFPDLEKLAKEELDKKKDLNLTSGRFVDPLTGLLIDREELEQEEYEEKPMYKEKTESIRKSLLPIYEEYFFEDYDAKYPCEKRKLPKVENINEYLSVKPRDIEKIEFDKRKVKKVSVPDIPQITKKFLDDLIVRIIEHCKDIENVNNMRETLDKSLMFETLMSTKENLDDLKRERSFLSKQAVQFYKRKGAFRYVKEEKPERVQDYKECYEQMLEHLDSSLGRELITEDIIFNQIEKVRENYKEIEKQNKNTLEEFENMVKKCFHKESMPNLSLIVQKELGHMAQLRKEISQVRSVIIRKQHVLGTLKAELYRMEDLGNGLTFTDYATLYRANQSLSQKIEYRNKDLKRSRKQFQHSLDVVTHTRMRMDLLLRHIDYACDTLEECEEMKSTVRKKVHKLTLKRECIRQQLFESNESCGLRDKPTLLLDYDETMIRLKENRKKVAELRITKADLDQRLQNIQSTNSIKAKTNSITTKLNSPLAKPNSILAKPKTVLKKSKNLKNLQFRL